MPLGRGIWGWLYVGRGLLAVQDDTLGTQIIETFDPNSASVFGVTVGDALTKVHALWGPPDTREPTSQFWLREGWALRIKPDSTGTRVGTLGVGRRAPAPAFLHP